VETDLSGKIGADFFCHFFFLHFFSVFTIDATE